MTDFDYIQAELPEEVLLLQLVEECSELSAECSAMAKAALKVVRIRDGRNPTPVTMDSAYIALRAAYDNLVEEISDVMTEKTKQRSDTMNRSVPMSKNEAQRLLPEIGDKCMEYPTIDEASNSGHHGGMRRQPCTVVAVYPAHLWYTVQFENGIRESYKVPKVIPQNGGPAR